MKTLPDDLLIHVCEACLRSVCWQGLFMCERAQASAMIEMPVGQLRTLKREHEGYWEKDYNAQDWRRKTGEAA